MTKREWSSVALKLVSYWPGSKMDAPDVSIWYEALKAYEFGEVESALERLVNQGSSFAPSLPEIVHGIELVRQGPAPGWREANRAIGRYITMLPYHDPRAGWGAYIEKLGEIHEAVARFAIALGPRGCREKPDPEFPQTDTGASVALTQMEREYREVTASWKADPTRGVALTEAKRQALGGTTADVLESLRPVAELESGE